MPPLSELETESYVIDEAMRKAFDRGLESLMRVMEAFQVGLTLLAKLLVFIISVRRDSFQALQTMLIFINFMNKFVSLTMASLRQLSIYERKPMHSEDRGVLKENFLFF